MTPLLPALTETTLRSQVYVWAYFWDAEWVWPVQIKQVARRGGELCVEVKSERNPNPQAWGYRAWVPVRDIMTRKPDGAQSRPCHRRKWRSLT